MKNSIELFFSQVKEHPFLKKSKIIYIGESNTGHVSGMVADMFSKDPRVMAFRGKPEGDAGIRTDENERDAHLQTLIEVTDRRALVFMDDFVVINCEPGREDEERARIKGELLTEFSRARLTVKHSKPGIATHAHFDSRHDENGRFIKEWKDDMQDAFLIAVLNGNRVEKRLPYYCPPHYFTL
ncbi:MAG: hypothetical protein JSS82_00050 [Bacteroidetes bacterium]|nr:hypothetical protein [Bacteroidota bacterium]